MGNDHNVGSTTTTTATTTTTTTISMLFGSGVLIFLPWGVYGIKSLKLYYFSNSSRHYYYY